MGGDGRVSDGFGGDVGGRGEGDELGSLIPEGTEVLAGLEMGGIAVVTALGLRTGLPCAFVRKKAKPYGTKRLARAMPAT